MTDQLDISVVVPSYNGAASIASTLESILAQSLAPREIIVIDDGSSDDTVAITRGVSADIIIIQTENEGVQAARNLGIARAAGSWIALCDHDDLWLAGHLAAHAALIAAEPSVQFSFSNFQTMRDGAMLPGDKFADAPAWFWDAPGRRVLPQGWVFDQPIAERTFRFHPIFPSAILVSKQLVSDIGGFDTAIRGFSAEDGEFILRCLYDSVVGAIPEPTVIIRRHDSNFSGDQVRNLIDEVRLLAKIRDGHAQAAPFRATIDDEIALRSLAALDAAFAAQDHASVRRISKEFTALPGGLKPKLKQIIAALPDSLGLPLNRAMQRAAGGRVATEADRRR